jgi:hypothetical protein
MAFLGLASSWRIKEAGLAELERAADDVADTANSQPFYTSGRSSS